MFKVLVFQTLYNLADKQVEYRILTLICILTGLDTHIKAVMRTNIVIDDDLMANALKTTGVRTKRKAVELGLKTLILNCNPYQ